MKVIQDIAALVTFPFNEHQGGIVISGEDIAKHGFVDETGRYWAAYEKRPEVLN